VALALTPGIGAARLRALLDCFGSADGALAAPSALLCRVAGISPACATAIKQASAGQGTEILRHVESLGATCLLPGDPRFPAVLADIPEPPQLLFALGRLDLLAPPAVAIVGSRDHSPYGAECCRLIAAQSARAGLAVVSGMARGLDAVAHHAALDAGGGTIGVLGNGLGVVYPAANRGLYQQVERNGLLLTEFPPGERPHPGSFPRRNRLISGLARVTVVVEAARGSGTMRTVESALEQGRDVMAVPGPITSMTSEGTNRLIRDGAEPLLEMADLLRHFEDVGIRGAGGQGGPEGLPDGRRGAVETQLEFPVSLSDLESLVARTLGGDAAIADDLALRLSQPVGVVLDALSGLELAGVVEAVSGGRFRRRS
jgi:DNA processing protein